MAGLATQGFFAGSITAAPFAAGRTGTASHSRQRRHHGRKLGSLVRIPYAPLRGAWCCRVRAAVPVL